MAELGFVGLGVMGGRMVKRLLDAGHTVTGYNRTKSKADWLIDAGMQWGDTPGAVAEAADFVFSMVTDTKALVAIADGADGIIAGLSAGNIYVDMSTVNPTISRELAAKAAEKQAQMLDAPVSGSVSTLEQGNLSIMAGGDETAFEQVKPILEDIGPTVTRVGGNGLAVSMKIALNLNVAVQIMAFSESVVLAEKSGIKREDAVEVILNSVVASPLLKYRGPFVLDMPNEAWFDVNLMQKDVNLALELGQQMDVSLLTAAVTNEILTATRAMGMGDKDFAIVFETLARMAGVNK